MDFNEYINNNDDEYASFFLLLKPLFGFAFLIIVGTSGYMLIEGWNLLDSLLMSVTTLTTVGYGFIHPLSFQGKIFTIIYISFGVILFLYLATEFARYIILVNFGRILSKRQMQAKLKKVENHYIVCGYGRTGAEIISQLINNKLDFVVIDKDPDFEEIAKKQNFLYIVGDATDDEILLRAGIDRAKGLFCALSDDVDNLYLTLSARNLNSALVIIARCIKATNELKFKKAGATNVILPYEISGRRMVASVLKPLVVDFLDVVMHTKGQELELKLEQFQLKKGSSLENKTILSSGLKQKTGVIIIAIKRNHDFITNPTPHTVLQADDYLIALGTSSELTAFECFALS